MWTVLLAFCLFTESPLTSWSTSTPSTPRLMNLCILGLDSGLGLTYHWLPRYVCVLCRNNSLLLNKLRLLTVSHWSGPHTATDPVLQSKSRCTSSISFHYTDSRLSCLSTHMWLNVVLVSLKAKDKDSKSYNCCHLVISHSTTKCICLLFSILTRQIGLLSLVVSVSWKETDSC